jgi:hypothetical protein
VQLTGIWAKCTKNLKKIVAFDETTEKHSESMSETEKSD